MIYRAIGLMSGSSLDGLDIVFVEFHENGGKWAYTIEAAACYTYPEEWEKKLKNAHSLSALEYQLLHTAYGHFLGEKVNSFIEQKNLHYKVALVASHGHTVFHIPERRMTAQIGDGAAIAAVTQLPVVSDLRAMDIAFGGQGAPIVPIGEKLLFAGYDYYLNIGGIANISIWKEGQLHAFDICPANRVLNMIANKAGKEYDENGNMARNGTVNEGLLQQLNEQEYYTKQLPKSLANDFGTEIIYPIIESYNLSASDALHTYCAHIAIQIKNAITDTLNSKPQTSNLKLLITGGGAFNSFLIEKINNVLQENNIEIVIPGENIVRYKEALIMAFIGVLRWREENNVLSSVTGASRDSIGGAFWMGREA